MRQEAHQGVVTCDLTLSLSEQFQLGQVSLDLAEKGINVLWGSFEIKNTRLLHKLLQQFAREPLPKGNLDLQEKMNAIADRFDQLPMYFLTFHGGSDVDQVLEAMDYAGTFLEKMGLSD
jgi:twinkle protein